MLKTQESIIIKFDFFDCQSVGQAKKLIGLVKAKYLIPIIDHLNLEANPRSSKTGAVTDAIQDSIEKVPDLFPFKTKGILLAASQYEEMERNRVKIIPQNREIEGILDGGHNTLAIGLYILRKAFEYKGYQFPRKSKTWDEFKSLWNEKRDIVSEYTNALRKDPDDRSLDFYVPIELLVPRDAKDPACVDQFKNDLLEICAARNNNVQLPVSAKANQSGYFDELKKLLGQYNPKVNERIEWKTNDGGEIKVQDIIALAWIPLSLITPVHDDSGRPIERVSANNLYSGKGACLKQFEKLMSSSEVTIETSADYKRELRNGEVLSAFEVAARIPELYDYIYENFPSKYNAAGGSYGRITAVKALNDKRRDKQTPFEGKAIETLSPDGYIVPLVYGLQALMEKTELANQHKIAWSCDPSEFLKQNFSKIVKYYSGILSICDYDPQKVGKSPQSYEQALAAYKMAKAGIL